MVMTKIMGLKSKNLVCHITDLLSLPP